MEKRKFKSSKWGRLRDQGAGRPGDQFDGRFWGRLRDVGHTRFLNSTEKHIKPTWAGYSSLYSEL